MASCFKSTGMEKTMNYGLIFAGGVGRRMNSKARPKQFLEIHGKPIIIHTIEHFEYHSDIDAICVVCVKDWMEYTKQLIEKFNIKKVRWIVPGGDSALESQYQGLQAIRSSNLYRSEDIVLIHDGVRPLIHEKTISDCIESVKKYGSAVTVAPAIETIVKSNQDNKIIEILPRDECQLARAPQSFFIGDILKAHSKAIQEKKHDFIDSASMMLHYGYEIYTVEGPAENIKVTNPSDFYMCRSLLDAIEDSQIYGV